MKLGFRGVFLRWNTRSRGCRVDEKLLVVVERYHGDGEKEEEKRKERWAMAFFCEGARWFGRCLFASGANPFSAVLNVRDWRGLAEFRKERRKREQDHSIRSLLSFCCGQMPIVNPLPTILVYHWLPYCLESLLFKRALARFRLRLTSTTSRLSPLLFSITSQSCLIKSRSPSLGFDLIIVLILGHFASLSSGQIRDHDFDHATLRLRYLKATL